MHDARKVSEHMEAEIILIGLPSIKFAHVIILGCLIRTQFITKEI